MNYSIIECKLCVYVSKKYSDEMKTEHYRLATLITPLKILQIILNNPNDICHTNKRNFM